MDQHTPIDYRLLVDNLTTAILLIDSNFNIFYLNSACEALLTLVCFALLTTGFKFTSCT